MALKFLEQPFSGIELSGLGEEPAMPEAEFDPRPDQFSGERLQPRAQRSEFPALYQCLSRPFDEARGLLEILCGQYVIHGFARQAILRIPAACTPVEFREQIALAAL